MFSMGKFPEICLHCLPCYSNDDYIQHCNNGPCMIQQHMHGNKIKYNWHTYCNFTNIKQYNYNIKHFFYYKGSERVLFSGQRSILNLRKFTLGGQIIMVFHLI